MAKLVAKTYSDALFEVGIEQNSLDKFLEELVFIENMFNEYPEFFELFVTPRISIESRKDAMEEVFKEKISDEMMNFLKILLDKKRGNEFSYIKEEFERAVHAHNNIIKATVITAVEMNEDQSEKVKEKLSGLTGNKILLKNKVDKDLIGGMVIYIGDKVIDGSLKKRLNDIKEELAQIIV
jgi:F-type H+-transporting ATPase subunit delta